ncbi:MAG: beta-lactamase family protein [Burkholderiales bacterium]|nr:beta-lactamase family protein [Burkholderiales bacterium]
MTSADLLLRRHVLTWGLAGGLGLARAADDPAQQAEQFVGDLVAAQRLPGLALAVMREGRPVFTRCWGNARPGAPSAIDEDTRFCLGSLSKPLLAQAVLMLVQDGRLRLDDRVQRHLGPVPAHWRAITVRQLLNHTSGLRSAGDPTQPDDMLADAGLRRQIQARGGAPFSEAEQLAVLQGFPLRTRPGQRFQYSNAGYNVLASVVGRVTGGAYDAFMQQRLFEPLGMTSARLLGADTDFDDMAAPCDVAPDGRVLDARAQLPPVNKVFYAGGCGGLQLSLRDLMRWDAGLGGRTLAGTALPPRFAAHLARLPQLWARPVPMGQGLGEDGRPLAYGLGWTVAHNAASGLRVGHGGFIPGFRAAYLRDVGGSGAPTRSVLVLTNQQAVDPGPVAATVAGIFARTAA